MSLDYDRITNELLMFYDAAGREAQNKYGPTNPSVDYLQTFHNEKSKARAKLMMARSPETLAGVIDSLSKSMENTARGSSPQTYEQFVSYTANLRENLSKVLVGDSPVIKALDTASDRATPWYKTTWFYVSISILVLGLGVASWKSGDGE